MQRLIQGQKKPIGLHRALLTGSAFAMCLLFAGCGDSTTEEEHMIIVETQEETARYKVTTPVIGDVVRSKNVKCTYSQIESEEISFELSGKLVSEVYVKKGDVVKKGQLLAELSGGSRESEIEQLEYQIARNRLLLEQLQENENNELSRRWLEHECYNNQGGVERLQANIEVYLRNNEYKRQEYQDAIRIDELQLANLKKEISQCSVYSSMEGSVAYIKKDLEGSTSVMDEVIMQIMDNSECMFVVSDLTYKDCVKEGQLLDLLLVTGSGAGKYKAEPYKMEEWTDAMFFTLAEGADNSVVEAGTAGTLTVIIDERREVLTLPASAVHSADDKYYVYTIGEGGIREVRWIEAGLIGNDKVEIISGVAEGEQVVLK